MATAMAEFGRHVRKERLARDWTIRDLAARSGLAVARIHRIETDPERGITSEDVLRLAGAFGMPMSWLAQGSQVRARVLAAARCAAQASAEEALDSVLPVVELAAQLDDLDNADAVVSGLPEQPRHRTAPRVWGRHVAEVLRNEWKLGTGPIHDLASVIEDHSNVMVVVAPLSEGVDGLAVADPQTGHTMIAVAETDRWERQRFTLAHELGHLIAGDRLVEAVTTRGQSLSETAASEFARNFLVPIAGLRRLQDERGRMWDEAAVAEAAWTYRVSPEVFAIQLSRANLAPDSLVNRVSTVSANTWSRLGGWEPQRRALAAAANTRRVPPGLLSRARDAWQAGLIPAATIARVLREETEAVVHDLSELRVEAATAVSR
jgi:Zn-dependent peptidase ImmA (M78 family)/transcriptional regulator with XRE-family HTH domain